MNEAEKFAREIAILDAQESSDLRAPSWLENRFEDSVWLGSFGEAGTKAIDFKVKLDDGSFLTARKNLQLLNIFKVWIASSADHYSDGLKPLKGSSLKRKLSVTLSLIDYFLVRAKEFKLAKFGLRLVTSNDIQMLLQELVANPSRSPTIYKWPELLKAYLDENSSMISDDEACKLQPLLADIQVPVDGYMLPASQEEVLQYRAYLWLKKLYRGQKAVNKDKGKRFEPHTSLLVKEIYADTLMGRFNHQKPPELILGAAPLQTTESPSVPVRNDEGSGLAARDLCRFTQSLSSLLPVENGLDGISEQDLSVAHSLALSEAGETGHFRTLPHRLVMVALRNAMEFFLRYSDVLFDAYVRSAALKQIQPSLSTRAAVKMVLEMGVEGLEPFNVQCWSISGVGDEGLRGCSGLYDDIRRGVGLRELMLVLAGSMHLVVGAVSARRISELVGQPANKAVCESGEHIVFDNRKSGSESFRSRETRPIPSIAVKMIKAGEYFQRRLIEVGCIEEFQCFFSYPAQKGFRLIANKSLVGHKHLDFFSDFFELEGREKGTRYYIRSHQLRRFFAMAFFWSGTPAGENTLSWFLAHTDPEHLYHYITEQTSGAVLRSVKAETVSELIGGDEELATELEALVLERFGVARLSILREAEFVEHLETLIEEESVIVEPVFMNSASGTTFRVGAHVIHEQGGSLCSS